jgi:hypothetical protein
MAKKKVTRRTAKAKPLWTPSMGLTVSAMRLWATCPEQFSLKYIDGWTPRRASTPIMYGSIWHAAQEHQGTRSPWKGVDNFIADYKKHASQSAVQEVEFLAAQVKTLFPLYAEHYRVQDASITWTRREAVFLQPFNVLSEKLPIAGRRDGEFRTAKKTLGLFETKTKSQIDRKAIADLLRSDLQTLVYCWSMWKEYKEAPGLILYNVVKRPTLRLGQSESKQAYLIRLADDCRKKPNDYFFRWQVQITEADLKRFEKELLLPICQAFLTWWRQVHRAPFLPERTDGRHPSHYTNLPALVTPYGKADLYDLMVLRLTAPYYRRSSAHNELV